MIKFRPVREYFDDAMKEVVEIETLADLIKHLRLGDAASKSIEFQSQRFDHRTGWNSDSYLVLVDGNPVGYTSGIPK